MKGLARAALALALMLFAASAALSEWLWREAAGEACAARALERLALAQRIAPWRVGLARELARRALAAGDYARLAQVLRAWQVDASALGLAARLETGLEAEVPDGARLQAACESAPVDCARLRVAVARRARRDAADHAAASAALEFSLRDCGTGACELPDPAIVEEALRLAWGFRSERGLVHAWLERAERGLPADAPGAWRLRTALDRNQLDVAAALVDGVDASCALPARAAELALLRASLRLRQERYPPARLEIERAEAIAGAAADPRAAARLLPYRAYLAMRQGRWETAAAAFEELARAGADAWERRDGLAGLGNVRMHQQRSVEAAQLYQRALDLDDRLASGDPAFRMRVLSMQAQAALQQGDPAAAGAPLERARELALARGDRGGAVVAWLASADYAHRRGDAGTALEAIDAALALEREGQAERVSPFLSAQYEQALQRAHALAAQPGSLGTQALETLWALHWTMRRRPQRQALAALPEGGGDPRPAGLQARLASGQQVLSYGYAGEQAFVLWLSERGLRLVDLPAGRAEIEELAARWLASLRAAQRGDDADPRGPAARLRAILIEPLWAAGMRREGRLLLNPAGALAGLPWAGLGGEGADGEWRHLVEDHELLLVPALDWLATPLPQSGSPALVVAAADAPPQALAEARFVAQVLGVRALEAPAEDELRRAAAQSGWLHFAGHGVRDSTHPLDAYLSLGTAAGADDGRLQVAEVLGARLQARVVVLGACEASESAQAQDWTWFPALDMATAMVLAGAGQVVASVLPAGDAQTEALMRAFYAERGVDAATALARAQRRVARELKVQHWAGFRVSGLGGL